MNFFILHGSTAKLPLRHKLDLMTITIVPLIGINASH